MGFVKSIKIALLIFNAVFLINLNSFLTFASEVKIINDGIFGISEDSVNTIDWSYILAKADSSYTDFLKEHRLMKIYTPIVIYKVFKFEELQDLYMLLIVDSAEIKYPWGGLYNSPILFNSKDSSFCYLNGDTLVFNSLIKKYLPYIFDNNMHRDLINLYLNSNSTYCSYYLLYTYSEYENIWASEKLLMDSLLSMEPVRDQENADYFKSSLGYDDKSIEKDLKKAKKIIKDYQIEKLDTSIIASFCSWDHCSGKIEYWSIKISPDRFSILERKTLKKEMGPYQRFKSL